MKVMEFFKHALKTECFHIKNNTVIIVFPSCCFLGRGAITEFAESPLV